MKIIKKIKDNVRKRRKRREDVKLARTEGYAEGCEDTTNELMRQIKALNNSVTHLTEENLRIEEHLRQHYEDRTNILENRYTDKCKKCMLATEAERERLRKNQNLILDLIQKFNVVFMKVFKHANLVVDEHDNIIKSSGRVKSSREILVGIKTEADKIIQKVLPLTSISLTENCVLNEEEIQTTIHSLVDKSKIRSSK